MIKVDLFRNGHGDVFSVRLKGHAGSGEEGYDIVCSAVSILVFNTVNCVELYTKSVFKTDIDNKKGGCLKFIIFPDDKGEYDHDAILLLKAMAKGLIDIENEYSCYISINDEEVQ